MAITKLTHGTEIASLDDSAKIQFICPVCKCEKILSFPRTIVNQATGLTTMSIAKGLVCEHQFQAFLDKNFKVRGYQKVDFEFERSIDTEPALRSLKRIREDKELFENLILEGNYLEYRPNHKDSNSKRNMENLISRSNNMTLKEIYDEFWEFIDEDNEIFQEFFKNDIEKRENKDHSKFI